jgi:hypothetical protein
MQSFNVRWSEASLAAQFPVWALPIQFDVTGTHLEQCTRQSYANGSAAFFITWGYIASHPASPLASAQANQWSAHGQTDCPTAP